MNGNETPSIGNSEAGNLQVQVLLCAPCFANSPEMIFEHYREVISADAAGQWFGIQAQSKKLKTESRNEKGETKRQRRAWRKPRRTLWKCRSRRWRHFHNVLRGFRHALRWRLVSPFSFLLSVFSFFD